MTSKLKQHFPIVREQAEVLAEIGKSAVLQDKFNQWTPAQQEDFLSLCTGVRGLKFLYDGFFKELMNPEYAPERFNDFLSHMLGQKVRVLKILPADSVRIADESSLLTMDIVVELEDGSIANIEMQKIGYAFPGQRSACYSADLLLRQYKRVRGLKQSGNQFNYRDIKNVYTIVLFEKSPKAFHEYPDKYYHFFEQKSDTGLKMELLQKYLFIPLDIFKKNHQNKDGYNKREAWLTLLSSDDPDTIIKLIEDYPEFRNIYEEGYRICLNIEKVMDMFSEELYELDRNTVQYMIDEMQDELDAKQAELNVVNSELDTVHTELDTAHTELDAAHTELDAAHTELDAVHTELGTAYIELDTAHTELNEMNIKYEQSIQNTINFLRSMGLTSQEIAAKICELYQFNQEQASKYL